MPIKDAEWSHKQTKKDREKFLELIDKQTLSTGIKVKRENWQKFAKFIENQFNHGGDKYSLPDQPDKEMTDLLCEMSPGKTGIDWIMQTIAKYCGRYINFEREKDLFKIATFAYIAWLKKGYHLKEEHDEDTNKEKED